MAFVFAGVEDFGIAFAESQACGIPVIALNRGGVRDIVKDGISGILFDEPTVAALKKAIQDSKRLSFDSAAIREISRKFSAAHFRAQFKKFISEKKR
jgi:glycosyltransferase involved in cell wall biosynthesis